MQSLMPKILTAPALNASHIQRLDMYNYIIQNCNY